MSRRESSRGIVWALGVLALIFAVWVMLHAPTAASTPAPTSVKTIALRPESLPVITGGLTGELERLRVTERIERETGKIREGPDLRGVLRLRNTSPNLVIRPLSGIVEYVDGGGAGIPLAKDQGTTVFTIYTERPGGLRPGEQITQAIDVPFPTDALTAHRLQDIRLHLTYLSTPYAKITISGPVSLGK